MDMLNIPLLAHADWSIRPQKRLLACAALVDDRYVVGAPRPVGDPRTLPARLALRARPVLLGVDFPLGLPEAYAAQVAVTRFTDLLPQLGAGRWERFFDVAVTADEISLTRPFYPRRPGGTRQAHLLSALNLPAVDALRRRCDRVTRRRRAASPLFWTLGAQQVGKAALAGWRDLLQPALGNPALQTALWPFDGPLPALLARSDLVVAETYPGELYPPFGPGSGPHRQQAAPGGPRPGRAAAAGVGGNTGRRNDGRIADDAQRWLRPVAGR